MLVDWVYMGIVERYSVRRLLDVTFAKMAVHLLISFVLSGWLMLWAAHPDATFPRSPEVRLFTYGSASLAIVVWTGTAVFRIVASWWSLRSAGICSRQLLITSPRDRSELSDAVLVDRSGLPLSGFWPVFEMWLLDIPSASRRLWVMPTRAQAERCGSGVSTQ